MLQVRVGLHLGQVSLNDSLETDIFCGHANKAVFAKLERV